MTTELAPENLYKDINLHASRYRYARIPLNNLPSGIASMLATSTTLCEWKLPASTVFNLSKSFIQYQITFPAGAAGSYACIHADGCDFRQVYFGNGSGLGITDLSSLDTYINSQRPYATSYDDFICRDQLNGMYPCNQLNSSNIFPQSLDGTLLGTANASTKSYTEPQHLEINPTPATVTTISRYFKLSDIVNSALSQNQDKVFGIDMYLRLWTQYLQRVGFYTTTPNNPNIDANSTSPIGNANMSNLVLYLAIQENLNIRDKLLTYLASGNMKMTVPYPYAYRFNSAPASTNASISITLTKNYGRLIKNISFVPYNGSEYKQYAYAHSNVNGTMINTIQSTMDGRPLTDYTLNCYNPNSSVNPLGVAWNNPATFADDWRENNKFISGSTITSYPMYASMWMYRDSWGTLAGLDSKIPDYLINDGFDLLKTGDHIYSVTALSGSGTNVTSNINGSGLVNYIYINFLRTLLVQPQSIILDY